MGGDIDLENQPLIKKQILENPVRTQTHVGKRRADEAIRPQLSPSGSGGFLICPYTGKWWESTPLSLLANI